MATSRLRSAAEAFPSRHRLDLVEAPHHGLAPAQSRESTIVLLDQDVELVRPEPRELLVFEVDERQTLARHPGGQPLAAELMEKRCLARAPHPDDGRRLSTQGYRSVDPARGAFRDRPAQRVGKLLGQAGTVPVASVVGRFRGHSVHLSPGRTIAGFLLIKRRNRTCGGQVADPFLGRALALLSRVTQSERQPALGRV